MRQPKRFKPTVYADGYFSGMKEDPSGEYVLYSCYKDHLVHAKEKLEKLRKAHDHSGH
jgi:hypothetical protein